MTGLKLRVPSKAQLAGLAWAVALRVLMVLYAAWFVDLLMGTPSRVDSRHLRDHHGWHDHPSIALDVAAAAVLIAGSYFECIYLGPTAALGGSWS